MTRSERLEEAPRTFPEWVKRHATWRDRLRCWLFGHDRKRPGWQPMDETEDRRNIGTYCFRCGDDP